MSTNECKQMKSKKGNQDMIELGQRLKLERERLGLTQDRLAKLGGVTRASQYLYEHGDRSPKADYLLNVINVGIDPMFLLKGVGHSGNSDNNLSSVQMDVLTVALQMIASKASRRRGNNMLTPENLISIIQILATKLSGKDNNAINWDELSAQIEGWFD